VTKIRSPISETRSKEATLSLTPCFSGVLPTNPTSVNHFNGFKGHRCSIYATPKKPLKRSTVIAGTPSTPLKQGVNENGVLAKKPRCSPD
jgi:hypothetical protein